MTAVQVARLVPVVPRGLVPVLVLARRRQERLRVLEPLLHLRQKAPEQIHLQMGLLLLGLRQLRLHLHRSFGLSFCGIRWPGMEQLLAQIGPQGLVPVPTVLVQRQLEPQLGRRQELLPGRRLVLRLGRRLVPLLERRLVLIHLQTGLELLRCCLRLVLELLHRLQMGLEPIRLQMELAPIRLRMGLLLRRLGLPLHRHMNFGFSCGDIRWPGMVRLRVLVVLRELAPVLVLELQLVLAPLLLHLRMGLVPLHRLRMEPEQLHLRMGLLLPRRLQMERGLILLRHRKALQLPVLLLPHPRRSSGCV